jgi:hypothetical protein
MPERRCGQEEEFVRPAGVVNFRLVTCHGTIFAVNQTLGEQFAHAVAAKDDAAVLELLHPELDFRAMTPARFWEAAEPKDVVDILATWFGNRGTLEQVVQVDTDRFADRERVGYRLQFRDGDAVQLVEQQAYLSERDGKIGWLRIMCTGFRPVE